MVAVTELIDFSNMIKRILESSNRNDAPKVQKASSNANASVKPAEKTIDKNSI